MSTDPNNSTGQIRASIRTILTSLQQALVDATGLDPHSVYITRRKDMPRNVAEFAIGIWVRGERPDPVAPGAVDAAGRVNDMRSRTVTLLIWSRTRLDEPDRDTARITDYTLGQLQLEDKVYNAAQLFQPLSTEDKAITSWPARCGAISDPQPDSKNDDFTVSMIDLQVNYVRDLDQSVQ